MPLRLDLALLALALVLPHSASAASVVVPDGYATIQAAIDAGVDSVIVKDGTYPDSIIVARGVTLLPYSTNYHTAFPKVGRLGIGGFSANQTARIEGLHFTGPVWTQGSWSGFTGATFEGCQFDSGLTSHGSGFGSPLKVHGCLIYGGADPTPYTLEFVNNTVVGGPLYPHNWSGTAAVRDNFVSDSPTWGIRMANSDGTAQLVGNHVHHCRYGIVIPYACGAIVSDNEIFDCDSTGLLLETGSSAHCQNMRFYYNSVRDCGGHGFDFEGLGSGEFVGNTVDHVGGDGIHFATPGTVSASQNDIDGTGGFGIWSRSAASIIDNRVVHAGTDGISCSSAYAMERNRVGRSGGRGIVARSTATRVHHNTVYLNAGAGFEVHGAIPDSVHHNIAYANTGPGLLWVDGASSGQLSCNDWFGNVGGTTSGITPGVNSVPVNPSFCDMAHDSVTLSSGSYLANAIGCGLIGALGVGCAQATDVPVLHAAGTAMIHAWPTPSHGATAFSWSGITGPARFEIFDALGARRWSADIAPRVNELSWSGRTVDGGQVPPGLYLARLTGIGGQVTTKVVVTH